MEKKELFRLLVLILGNFWCSLVTSITFSSNLSNFEKNPKKSPKNSKNLKKKLEKSQFFFLIQKISKISKKGD